MGSKTRRGVALILSAPSGTGKSTLVRMLRSEFPDFNFSVSYTTRPPRNNEVHGQDYHFVSLSEFNALQGQGFFAEWAEVHGNRYGTPLQATIDLLDQGHDLIFDIDVQGAFQLKNNLGQGCFTFLFPPSRLELRERLLKRGTESEESLSIRLENARDEIKHAPFFDYWIVNDTLDQAYQKLKAVYLSQQVLARTRPDLTEQVLSTWESDA